MKQLKHSKFALLYEGREQNTQFQQTLLDAGVTWPAGGKHIKNLEYYKGVIYVEDGVMTYSSQTWFEEKLEEGEYKDYKVFTDISQAFEPDAELVKPPIGLRPKRIVVQERITEILEAMHRYVAAGTEVPMDWRVELDDLLEGKKYVV